MLHSSCGRWALFHRRHTDYFRFLFKLVEHFLPMIRILLLLWVSPIFVVAQIGAKTQQASIIGIWQNSQFGYQMTLMLNADGSGEFDGEEIRYATQGNNLSIVQAGVTTVYTYVLQGNVLKLSGGDLEQSISFSKTGANQSNQVVVASQPTTAATSKQNAPELLGVWSGNGETLEFKNNGQCIYLGSVFEYEVSQGHITLKTAQGNAMFAYTLQGNQLQLSANGKNLMYSRGTAGANNSNSAKNTGAGNISQELVGKWCWTNTTSTNSGGSSSSECIVLNANGTYEYASERSMDTNTNAFYAGTSSQGSDRGTWWVQADRIFYNSQTRGQGSYQLQKLNHPKTGDPMIVLDGEPYVTFYQKQPWR